MTGPLLRLRLPARIACGLFLVIAFLLLGPVTEHEPVPWLVTSVGAALGVAGIGLGGSAVSFIAMTFALGILRDNAARAALFDFVLACLCILTEPWGKPANERRPRSATSALVFALVSAPAVIMMVMLAYENTRFAEPTNVVADFGALVGLGGPLLYYVLSALRAQKPFPQLGGKKRATLGGVVLSMQWIAFLAGLVTYVLNRH